MLSVDRRIITQSLMAYGPKPDTEFSMKLRLSSSLFLCALTSQAFANHPVIESTTFLDSGKFYVGAYGGSGVSNHFDASHFATAYFTEAEGGPLAVDAFGGLNRKSAPFFGVQLGYQAQEILFSPCSKWTLGVAAELEGYYMNKRTFEGDLINNTDRLPEHDFVVSYPMKKTVFLANAVLNFNHAHFQLHPYIGLGIGSAIVKITDASATQISPPEVGVNHYNADPGDTVSTFAGQAKFGLGYDINQCISLFAEYRWLYLADTHFVLGSTIFPNHTPTSSWQVKLDAQKYHLGNIGIRFNW